VKRCLSMFENYIFPESFHVQFKKTGIPWRFSYKGTPPPPPFEPIHVTVTQTDIHAHACPRGSINIVCDEYISLSNGCGTTELKSCYNLQMDGTIRYFTCEESGVVCKEWPRNVPTWRPIFCEEARQAAITFLLCSRNLRMIPKGVDVIIAKFLYDFRFDLCWLPRKDSEEKEQKRYKIK